MEPRSPPIRAVADVLVTARPSDQSWGNEVVATVETPTAQRFPRTTFVEHAASSIARCNRPRRSCSAPDPKAVPVGKADHRWARERRRPVSGGRQLESASHPTFVTSRLASQKRPLLGIKKLEAEDKKPTTISIPGSNKNQPPS